MNILKRKPLLIVVGVIVLLVITALLLFLRQQNKVVAPAPGKIATGSAVITPSLVTTGLHSPTDIAAGAGGKQLFITELAGIIQIVSLETDHKIRPYLDISNKVQADGEMGLLGLAFHPDYEKNGYFYVNYIDKEQNTVVARYKLSPNGVTADPESEKVLFWIKQPYANHNGGALAFGPDGYLYIAMGDGGGAGDPENRAQDKSSYFGKILRIDVDTPDSTKGLSYSSPTTNPFVKEKNAKPEIWAYGLRNPWRISFDSTTGSLFIADVGQGRREEIDLQPASSKGGENYGWRCREGTIDFKADDCQSATAYIAPILEYNHEEDRCSITGGHVYHGNKYPNLTDKYFYADYCSGQLYYASKSNGKWQQTLVTKTPYAISTFGQDNAGELYFTDYTTGSLYRLREEIN